MSTYAQCTGCAAVCAQNRRWDLKVLRWNILIVFIATSPGYEVERAWRRIFLLSNAIRARRAWQLSLRMERHSYGMLIHAAIICVKIARTSSLQMIAARQMPAFCQPQTRNNALFMTSRAEAVVRSRSLVELADGFLTNRAAKDYLMRR
jgi:hypothetical protein